MYYCEVLVSSHRYHGSSPLTYSSAESLLLGLVVTVPLGQQTVLGIVSKIVAKPEFVAKQIDSIVSERPLPTPLLSLHSWLLDYYPAPLGLTTQLFLPSSLATTARSGKKEEKGNSMEIVAELPPLNTEQQAALRDISSGAGSFLLHGETGSGKTRVYIELTREAIQNGTSAIILTPEIGLTPQLAQSFEATFPSQVIIVHSTQTPAQRRDSWNRIHNSSMPVVIIGPRSALFSPVEKVGLIVLDEAHDTAYKQDQAPYYQTSRVAAQLARLHEAKLVLGTATPLIHDYYAFSQKKLPILRMETSAIGTSDVAVEIINLTDRQNFTRSPWLSNQLIREINASINEGFQSLIFLNRRGTARVILCQNCGWQATCPRCDLPLTYHGDVHKLQCHTCGLTDRTPVSCPECGQAEIKFKSIGTKTIVTELTRLFPEAAILRFDSDNKKSESLATSFETIKQGNVDIIVGTQMLSKGLDLPLLRVIGIVMADTGLYFPDYTAEERTFQMLRQIIGRVGRGHTSGKVIVQTHQPDSTTMKAAVMKDFAQFYESQISERELYRFPPFYFVLKIVVSRAVQSAARKVAHEISKEVLHLGLAIEISGPSPSFTEKTHDRYHWQIIVKAKSRGELIAVIHSLPKNCTYDIDPSNLL